MKNLLFLSCLLNTACFDFLKSAEEEDEAEDDERREGQRQGDCTDGEDNDDDDDIDCDDSGCADKPACKDTTQTTESAIVIVDTAAEDTSNEQDSGSQEPDPNDIDDDGDGFSENEGDCEDGDPAINPGAEEIVNDGIDQDCDGQDGMSTETALAIEILWSVPDDDFDLHLIYGAGEVTTDQDCHYENCIGQSLDWGITGVTEDNPMLVIDDIAGTGPERIEVNQPDSNAEYTVIVHDYPGTVFEEVNEVTTNIYIYGVLSWTGTSSIVGEDSYTTIATIDWSSQTVTAIN